MHLDVRNSGMLWIITNQTAPQCAAKDTLLDGVNISVCENNSTWSVFLDPVTIIHKPIYRPNACNMLMLELHVHKLQSFKFHIYSLEIRICIEINSVA